MLRKHLRGWAAKSILLPTLVALLVAGPVSMGAKAIAIGQVDPPSVNYTLRPGETVTITKTVAVPVVPPKLDLLLMVDNSGSYGDDLPVIAGLAPGIFDAVRAGIPDSLFGLATFVDFPFFPWGWSIAGDYAYSLNQDLTTDKATWVAAVSAMTIRDGWDFPESQYEALYQATTGFGRDLPPYDGDYADLGEIAPGGNASFRDGATSVIAITTDASFHTPGDSVCFFPAPCQIAEAILDAFEALTFNITAQTVGCEPLLEISFNPPVHEDVFGGEVVEFEETITVPAGVTVDMLPEDGLVCCTVEFKADETVIGTQDIWQPWLTQKQCS